MFPFPGLFNVFNAMLAASVCMKLGIDLDTIAEGLKSVKGVSGRMESLPAEGFDFSVILDFAHTPDGLSNLLSAVQGFAKGRVIAVFGCGGDRDNAKRPIMGATAAKPCRLLCCNIRQSAHGRSDAHHQHGA